MLKVKGKGLEVLSSRCGMCKMMKKSGFTLVEMLASIAIMGYTLSVVLLTYNNSIILNEMSRNMTAAVSHGGYILEDIRTSSFASVTSYISANHWNWDTSDLTANGLTPLRNENITVTSSGSNPVEITVTVSWEDLNDRSRTFVMKTLVSG